jgi:integrase
VSVTKYKTKAGVRWRVRLYDPAKGDMAAVSSGWLTKKAAKEDEARAIAAGRAESPAEITVAVWRERWLGHHPMKASTRQHNAERTKAFADEHGDMRMADVDRSLAIAWRREHPSTTMALSAMWTAAREGEELPVGQPWAGMASNGRRTIEPGWLTAADVDALVGHARAAWPGAYGDVVAAMVVVLAYTGIRPGELGGLQWADLDPEHDRLRVARQLSAKSRTLTTPKNGHARAVVYPTIAQQFVAAMPRLHDLHVFVGPGGGLLTESTRNRIWHPVRVRFDRPAMEIYELRHFCATYLVERGLTSSDIAIQLGQRDGGRLVESTYGHARPDPALQRVAAALAASDPTQAQEATA